MDEIVDVGDDCLAWGQELFFLNGLLVVLFLDAIFVMLQLMGYQLFRKNS